MWRDASPSPRPRSDGGHKDFFLNDRDHISSGDALLIVDVQKDVIKRLCVTPRAFDKSNGCDTDRRRDPTPSHSLVFGGEGAKGDFVRK